MICKFCLKDTKLVECHIIPRSFYKPLLNPHAIILSDKSYTKRSQTGIYDKNVVCEDCESLFSHLDDYAYRLLSTPIPEDELIAYNGERVVYFIKDYNYNKLKVFFLSLLWRASSSNLEYFKLIKVKPFENNLKEMIKKIILGMKMSFQ